MHHSEALHSLYCSPNIVWVIKYRRIKWAGHVVRMPAGNLQERDLYEGLGVDKAILEWILKK